MAMVGERLRSLRESLSISQKKLGYIIGKGQTTINRYEHEESEAPYKILLWYADYFDVSMDYIFGRTEHPQGMLYSYEPQVLKKKIEDRQEWELFIQACFEPGSAMNEKLKEALVNIAEDAQ